MEGRVMNYDSAKMCIERIAAGYRWDGWHT